MTLTFGVDVTLEEDESVVGVAVPDNAGVPVAGLRLDISPVVVRCRARPSEDDGSEPSCKNIERAKCHGMMTSLTESLSYTFILTAETAALKTLHGTYWKKS